jgi:16S rRNA (guanine527-N7)-methyltransferase
VEQREVAIRIGQRVTRAGLTATGTTLDLLTAYVELLARWNQRINLTAFSLTPPSDEALDRLLIEPLAAALRIRRDDRLLIDIGSGGGSPSIPLRIAAPWLRVVLVESRVRKCAFLREVVRQLGLSAVEVENGRLEELLIRGDLCKTADIVTIRAVRADTKLWGTAQRLLKKGGRVFWFTTQTGPESARLPASLVVESCGALLSPTGSRLVVLGNRQ